MQTVYVGFLLSLGSALFMLLTSKWWEPFADSLRNPFYVPRRVKGLLDAVERLCEIRKDLFRLDAHPCSAQAKGWLKKVNDLCTEAEAIKTGEDKIGWSYFRRCSLGNKADRELKKASDLISDGKALLQDARARPPLVQNVLLQYPPPHTLFGMDSYKDELLHFMRSEKGAQLGIWGMAGVGKTTLMQLARDSPSGFVNYDHVMYIQAGKGCTVDTIRAAIAVRLGLALVPSEQAALIFNHLIDKNFLFLIDDLWNPLDLKAVGIPLPLGSVNVVSRDGSVLTVKRKLVVASRNVKVCANMGCSNNVIRLDCLSQEDAWNLFTHAVGKEIAEPNPIHQFARKIVDHCGGLPLALCTIGASLSTAEDPKHWICAIDLLTESKLIELTEMDESLFECLKLSLDSLTEIRRACFLLCSLWPEGENIPREKLVEWWIGLGLLDADNPIEWGHCIIDSLVEASLLSIGDTGLHTSSSSHVKMHPMMRNMALWLVNDRGDKTVWLPHSVCRSKMPAGKWSMAEKAWVLLADSERWPFEDIFSKLTMLVTRDVFKLHPIHSFTAITFLDLEGTRREKFPMEICNLLKLQYLNLSRTNINALPLELKCLSELKYLHVRNTGALEIISKGLISQLKKLEVLDLFCSGCNIDRSQYLVSLMEELTSKTMNVTTLGISVQSRSDVTEVGQINRVILRALCMYCFQDDNHPEKIDLQLLSKLSSLRELAIVKNSLSKELVAEGDPTYNEHGLLPHVEFLQLRCLLNLEKVRWTNAGRRIRVVNIYNCPRLRHISWVQHLWSLEELTIAYCPVLQQLVNNEELCVAGNQKATGFHQLKRLYLEELPRLSSISERSFPFEELSYVSVANCNKLKAIRVEKRTSKVKILVDCSDSWWTALGQNGGIMNHHFVRRS